MVLVWPAVVSGTLAPGSCGACQLCGAPLPTCLRVSRTGPGSELISDGWKRKSSPASTSTDWVPSGAGVSVTASGWRDSFRPGLSGWPQAARTSTSAHPTVILTAPAPTAQTVQPAPVRPAGQWDVRSRPRQPGRAKPLLTGPAPAARFPSTGRAGAGGLDQLGVPCSSAGRTSSAAGPSSPSGGSLAAGSWNSGSSGPPRAAVAYAGGTPRTA